MGILLIIVPVFLIIYFLNERRKKKGLSLVSEGYIVPTALFIVMCIVVYQLHVDLLQAVIIFGFGLLTGSTFEHAKK